MTKPRRLRLQGNTQILQILVDWNCPVNLAAGASGRGNGVKTDSRSVGRGQLAMKRMALGLYVDDVTLDKRYGLIPRVGGRPEKPTGHDTGWGL